VGLPELPSQGARAVGGAITGANVKLVFLDFDGVIVTQKTRYMKGDPECIAALNRIVETTGAAVVVSSCWRLGMNVVELRELLRDWGFEGKVIDRTAAMLPDRGNEIAAWLESCPRDVERFVILDDDADMVHLKPRLIQTSGDIGLTEDDAARAIAMLK